MYLGHDTIEARGVLVPVQMMFHTCIRMFSDAHEPVTKFILGSLQANDNWVPFDRAVEL
jgi:hypothetical protein